MRREDWRRDFERSLCSVGRALMSFGRVTRGARCFPQDFSGIRIFMAFFLFWFVGGVWIVDGKYTLLVEKLARKTGEEVEYKAIG